MKYLLSIIIISILVSCTDRTENRNVSNQKSESHKQMPSQKKEIIHPKLVSERDTVCGMHLSETVTDTAIINGKTYGFCSHKCKQEFVPNSNVKK